MRTRLAILTAAATACLLVVHLKADEFPPMFPFVISYDGPDNATSMASFPGTVGCRSTGKQ